MKSAEDSSSSLNIDRDAYRLSMNIRAQIVVSQKKSLNRINIARIGVGINAIEIHNTQFSSLNTMP